MKNLRGNRLFEITTELLHLKKTANEYYFRLGGLLKEVRDNQLWAESYESFTAYCADPELDFSVSHAKNAITLVERFPNWQRLIDIGYSKLLAIAPHIEKHDKDELIGMARSLSRSDLYHELAELKLKRDTSYTPLPKIYRCGVCSGVRGIYPGDLCRCGLTDDEVKKRNEK